MTIGEKIQYLRNQKHISQEDLAENIGISRQAISKWETDQSVPDLENIKCLADFFQVKMSSLIEEGDIFPQETMASTKTNTLLRTSRFLFIASISLSCFYLLFMIYILVFQDVLGYSHSFVFPIPTFLFNIFLCFELMGCNFCLWKETKKNSRGIAIEAVFIILSALFPILGQSLVSKLETEIITNSIYKQAEMGSSYLTVMSQLNNRKTIFYVGLIAFLVGATILLSVKHISEKGYRVHLPEKSFNLGYGVLSFFLGVVSWITVPLTAYWLYEIKQSDKARFKSMCIPFVVGVVLQGIIYIIILIVTIVLKCNL